MVASLIPLIDVERLADRSLRARLPEGWVLRFVLSETADSDGSEALQLDLFVDASWGRILQPMEIRAIADDLENHLTSMGDERFVHVAFVPVARAAAE